MPIADDEVVLTTNVETIWLDVDNAVMLGSNVEIFWVEVVNEVVVAC